MNNDYVILVDENGQPYIAHGVIGDTARKVWGAVKGVKPRYLEKVRTKSGLWRYLYTPEEVAALGNERRAKNTSTGNTSADAARYAGTKRVADQARQRVQGNRQELAENIKSTPGKAKMKAMDMLGYDERSRYQVARQTGRKNGESDQEYAKRLSKLQDEYRDSIVGRVDKAKETFAKYAGTLMSSIRKAKTNAQDKWGVDERSRYQVARQNGKKNGESDQEYAKRLDKLKKEYESSMAGKWDRAFKKKR